MHGKMCWMTKQTPIGEWPSAILSCRFSQVANAQHINGLAMLAALECWNACCIPMALINLQIKIAAAKVEQLL